MEDTLGECHFWFIWNLSIHVLILIVMEDILGVVPLLLLTTRHSGLNPYCNGRYSWRRIPGVLLSRNTVLILIVMEDTLGVKYY